MTPFSIPAYDAVDSENGILPAEGWHDMTWTAHEAKLSKKGSSMMVLEFTIDNGVYSGVKITEYIVFGLTDGFGEAKLKKILESDGTFKWAQKPTLEEFSAQFPTGKIRVGGLLKYDYQIEKEYKSWESVSEHAYQEFTGKKSIKVQIGDFRGAEKPAQLKFVEQTAAEVNDEAELPF